MTHSFLLHIFVYLLIEAVNPLTSAESGNEVGIPGKSDEA
jgi:hypothetical protein